MGAVNRKASVGLGTGPRGSVVLGVTGSIAAYKAADLTSKLTQAGLDVHVIMTACAAKLVQPHTFLTLSRNPVIADLWDLPDWQPGHVALADRTQVLVVAPATANCLAKLAHGIGDDALTTYALSHAGPVIVAPAMNPRMWANAAVQENCRILRERGVTLVTPEVGHVACGPEGQGRLAAVETIFAAVRVHLAAARLAATGQKPRRVLVTAGPTQEAVDPVRFISNRSSGKMGYAIAAVAAAAGHETVLISGPTALAKPVGCRCLDVVSAADMAAAVRAEFPDCDLLVMCAAVADYRPVRVSPQKIRKAKETLVLTLEPTEDILMSMSCQRRRGQVLVGFAAETENLAASARAKLKRKGLDWIVANDVSRSDIGFGADCNEVTLFSASRTLRLPRQEKTELAAEVLRVVLGASRGRTGA